MTLQSPTATLIPLFSSSELTGCGYPDQLDQKKSFGHVPPVGVVPSTSYVNGEHPIHQARRSAVQLRYNIMSKKTKKKKKKKNRRTFTEYSVIIISLAVLQMKVVGGRKMGINSMHFEKKLK